MEETGTAIQKDSVLKELATLKKEDDLGFEYAPDKLREKRRRIFFLEQRLEWLNDRERRGIPDPFIPR